MFNATTNDNRAVSWTTSGGSVSHTTDSGNEDLASARFQMAAMTANGSGVATITAQTTGGIILWNGFDIAAVSAAPTFAGWIGGFEGLGGLTAFSDDPDGDGILNGLENFFGTHPGESSRGLIAGSLQTDGNTTFSFSHPLNESPAGDIRAAYRWSKGLSRFHGSGEAFEGTSVTFSRGTAVDGIVTVTASTTSTPVDRLVVDVEVMKQ